jgi:hypothetical protein
MTKKLWIQATHQQWKINIFTLIQLICGGFFLKFFFVEMEGIESLKHCLCMLVLLIGSWIWFINIIKCPNCGYKPVWPLVRRFSIDKPFEELSKMKRCPKCVAKEGGINELNNIDPIKIFEKEETKHPRPLVISVMGLFIIIFASVMLLYRILDYLHILPSEANFTAQNFLSFVVNVYWLISALGTFRMKEWARKGTVFAPSIFILISLLNYKTYTEKLKIRAIFLIASLVPLMIFYSLPKIKSEFKRTNET